MDVLKRLAVSILAMTLLSALLTVSAFADVLPEPTDSFVKSHRSECRYEGRRYIVNSPEGYAVKYKNPLSDRQTGFVYNGDVVFAEYAYTTGGEKWALCGGGWLKTSECYPDRDYEGFLELHGDELIEYDASFGEAIKSAGEVVFWTWPCSGEMFDERGIIDSPWLSAPENLEYWRDGDGRVWGHLSYYFGRRDMWICASDPASTDIPADETVFPITATIYPPFDGTPKLQNSLPVVTVALVGGVVLVTLSLILVFFGKKRRGTAK